MLKLGGGSQLRSIYKNRNCEKIWRRNYPFMGHVWGGGSGGEVRTGGGEGGGGEGGEGGGGSAADCCSPVQHRL